MISREEARALVMERLRSDPVHADDLLILDEETIERDWGWVFACAARGRTKPPDPGASTAPRLRYVVHRANGILREAGVQEPVEAFVQRYEDQLERALQSWALHVEEEPTRSTLKTLRSVLRVKRLEMPELRRRLPGIVRRGARSDLLPLCERLREAGVRAELRLSTRPREDG